MLIAAFLLWLLCNALLMAWVLFPRRRRYSIERRRA